MNRFARLSVVSLSLGLLSQSQPVMVKARESCTLVQADPVFESSGLEARREPVMDATLRRALRATIV
jgi:hypothetical protein